MTRDDLFNINAGIVKGLIEVIADVAPKAYILIISNPVNSTVPIAAEVLKAKGVFNAQRLFGVTTLDVVRAETFVAEITGESQPQKLNIPVIGGHSGETIVPLFSQAKPSVSIPSEKLADLVKRVQFGGDEVVKAKDGAGSATLSMAYAGFRFAEKVLKGLSGEKGIVEPSYIFLSGVPGGDAVAKETGVDFFSVPVELGVSGPCNLLLRTLLICFPAKWCRESPQPTHQHRRQREDPPQGRRRRIEGQHQEGSGLCTQPTTKVNASACVDPLRSHSMSFIKKNTNIIIIETCIGSITDCISSFLWLDFLTDVWRMLDRL